MGSPLLLLLLLLGVVTGTPQPAPDRPLFDDLKNVMPFEPVRYSSANVSTAYRVTSRFNPRGMGHLYLVTNYFMDFIQKGDPFPRVVVPFPALIRSNVGLQLHLRE
ncbi:hypothetical protein B566_EDAN009581 [Ephemera danica]|nr:hypothetical protein B566_EDAN009581 [Ephemera danica]